LDDLHLAGLTQPSGPPAARARCPATQEHEKS
jgi:hypothetical protein